MPESKPALDDTTQLATTAIFLKEALELVRKLTGQLGLTEQRLRDLVDGLGVDEFYGDHIDTPLAAARTLLEDEGK